MSHRSNHLSPAVKVRPEAIAQAIDSVRAALDATDYHADTVVSAYLSSATSLPEQAYAWMMAAILIADIADVDSMVLRHLQTSIWRGTQDALWY